MSFSPLVFTGVSKFSSDFQTILDRAANIARLPAKALENQQKDLLQQKLLVANLATSVESLANAVAKLGEISSTKALKAVSSNAAKVEATNVNSSSPVLYTISEITSVAKSAAEVSVDGYSDAHTVPVSSTGTVRLTVGAKSYDIDLSGQNNLEALRDSINSLHAGVTATVLATGSGPNPYYLSVTANTTGKTTLTLQDDPQGANLDLLTTQNQGANTEFLLNGVPISKKSTLINDVVPGVIFTIRGLTDPDEQIQVNVGSSRASLGSAIETFIASYNSLREQLNGQIGESAGLLSGDYLVREIHSQLSRLTGYQGGSGSIVSLADLGIEWDRNGLATLNRQTFDSLSDQQVQDSFSFLGDATSGFGGLARGLHQIGDPFNGLGQIQIRQYDLASARISARIAEIDQRVVELQKSVSARLQMMDSLLGMLESQQGLLDASLQSLSFASYGKQKE